MVRPGRSRLDRCRDMRDEFHSRASHPSRKSPARLAKVAERPHIEQWFHTLGRPKIGLLIGVFFLATFCFTCFETTLGLLVLQKFGVDPETPQGIKIATHLFMYAGIVGAVFQGGATGRLVKMLGEPKLVAVSMLCVALSLGPMPFAGTWTGIYIFLGLLAIGSSMTRPPVFGMISNLSGPVPRNKGVTIGIAQSAGRSLARILGPIFSATLFMQDVRLPYLICAAVAFLTGLIAWQRLGRGLRVAPVAAEEVPQAPA